MVNSVKTTDSGYLPIYQTTRGDVIESVHFGAIAIVDASGNIFASYGNPQTATFMRSSSKPFQAIPLVEMGGIDFFKMTETELAITCASHSGTDSHTKTIYGLQQKIGIGDHDLQCGTHQPFDKSTRALLKDRGEQPNPKHHNCSGKHTGMLGQAKLMGADTEGYTEQDHPIQTQILKTVSDLCNIQISDIQLGQDGCSVPTFCMPLYHAAWGWARLTYPDDLPEKRKLACKSITEAMTTNPLMVAGPGRLDTVLMEKSTGTIISKAGAEAYQAAGIRKDALFPGSPALGIALKISEGDQRKLVRRAVLIEVLHQLKILSTERLSEYATFGPVLPIYNQRQIEIGSGKPCFQLQYS